MNKTIYIGADHAGFVMKESIKAKLESQGFHIEDLGAHELDPNDDYPRYAASVARAVQNHKDTLGILSCGNAEGVSIAANKFDGIRAGVGFSKDSARTMREDDNANIICIPGRIETMDDPISIVDTFIKTKFSGAARHKRRLAKVSKFEHESVEIVPTILVQNLDIFKKRVSHSGIRKLAPLWQVDVLDDSMFDSRSFFNAKQIAKIKDLPNFELHLMILDPLPIIEEWKFNIPTLKRVIVHAEIDKPLEPILAYAKNLGFDVSLALNPETSIKAIKPVYHLLDSILIMGVHPGASGQGFLGKKILKKIKKTTKKYPNLRISVDGGVNQDTASYIINAGANQLCISSAIWKADDPVEAFNNLSTEDI